MFLKEKSFKFKSYFWSKNDNHFSLFLQQYALEISAEMHIKNSFTLFAKLVFALRTMLSICDSFIFENLVTHQLKTA